jgi:hypothetical protein
MKGSVRGSGRVRFEDRRASGSQAYFATLSLLGFGERQNPVGLSKRLVTAGSCWRRGRDSIAAISSKCR